MKKLTDFITGYSTKRLSSVEVDKLKSNQHEFNGVSGLKALFGTEKIPDLDAEFIYASDADDLIFGMGHVTWYDARLKDSTRSAEYRLYYSDNEAISNASEGDLLIIARRANSGRVIVIIAEKDSIPENQLIGLLEIQSEISTFSTIVFDSAKFRELNYGSKLVLETLGFEIPYTYDQLLDDIRLKYSEGFPATKVLSGEIADHLVKARRIDVIDDPDHATSLLLETEEMVFRAIEKIHVEKRLTEGFLGVDDFIQYSLSVHNRRKSRAGHAFENHLSSVFSHNNIRFSHGAVSENKSKPDFIFPGVAEYHMQTFDAHRLTMLGVKTSCKDRWRQILSEADRVDHKHLATKEPWISAAQTDEMKARSVTLVIPRALHDTFTENQLKGIITVNEFIKIVQSRQ